LTDRTLLESLVEFKGKKKATSCKGGLTRFCWVFVFFEKVRIFIAKN